MPAYLVARIEITDPEKFKDYQKAVPAVIAKYGGKYVVRGGEMTVLEGTAERRRIVVVEFPSLARAKEFFASPDYTEVRKFREGAAIGEIIAVEGV